MLKTNSIFSSTKINFHMKEKFDTLLVLRTQSACHYGPSKLEKGWFFWPEMCPCFPGQGQEFELLGMFTSPQPHNPNSQKSLKNSKKVLKKRVKWNWRKQRTDWHSHEMTNDVFPLRQETLREFSLTSDISVLSTTKLSVSTLECNSLVLRSQSWLKPRI